MFARRPYFFNVEIMQDLVNKETVCECPLLDAGPVRQIESLFSTAKREPLPQVKIHPTQDRTGGFFWGLHSYLHPFFFFFF